MFEKKQTILQIIGIFALLFLTFASFLWININATNDSNLIPLDLSQKENNNTQIFNLTSPKEQKLNIYPIMEDSEALKKDLGNKKVKGSNLTPKNAYGIVVGIADYPGSSNDLSYTDDDAQDIYSLLINEYNFKEENIIYLQDSAASKSKISNAFDQIASQISDDDIFFFYYSGHGGFGTEEAGPYSVNRESPHNYPNNYDNTWSISHSGAAYMRVHFHRLSTEYGCDFILCGDSDVTSGWYYELFSGNYGYDFWSYYIPVDRYYIRLISDVSITDYGFKIDQYEALMPDGTHYLCSYDSIPNSPENYYIDDLIDSKLDTINSSEKYIVVDACHSGGLIPEVQQIGRYIMTACEDDEYSLEDSGLQHGVFTNFFLESITQASDSNGDGALSMEEYYDYTRTNTISYSSGIGYTHHPVESDNITGETILNTNFSSVSLNQNGNSLNYSFEMHGIGLINELKIAVYNITGENYYYNISDLTTMSISETGFENYSGVIQLEYVSALSGYGIFANITSNQNILLNHTHSGDKDNDGLDDMLEIFIGSNPAREDTDYDGLNDYIEFSIHTNPNSNDTDSDQLSDFYEVTYNLDPCTYDSQTDFDNDGLSNLLEHDLGSLPNDPDTDNDDMPDGWEYIYNLNLFIDDAYSDYDFDGLFNLFEYYLMTIPIVQDSDDDGLLDGAEVFTYSTDPLNPDSDSDGTLDGAEIAINTNPLDSRDSDNKIILNYIAIGILIPLGISGAIVSIKYVKKRKEEGISEKEKINKFKFKLKPDTYNSLKTDKIERPQRVIPTRYTPRSTFEIESMKSKIKDLLINRLPPPEPSNSERGRNATVLALLASNDLKNGRLQEAAQKMMQALLLGVPEPYNTQIKEYLLKSLNIYEEKPKYIPPTSKISKKELKKCPYCGQINEAESKFCIKCGKRFEQDMKIQQGVKICKNCGAVNDPESKFCIKCGGKL